MSDAPVGRPSATADPSGSGEDAVPAPSDERVDRSPERGLPSRIAGLVRRFPWVVATLGVAAVAGGLSLSGLGEVGSGILTMYVLLMAARSAWTMVQALRHGTFGVDVIAVTAIGASVLVGELWAAMVVVLMLTTGRALEEYAAGRAQRDLTALLAGRPQYAHRFTDGFAVEDVPAESILPRQRILVRANEVVPVDGVLISADGTFDESSTTGESLPVDRRAGDLIGSGAVNGSVPVVLEAQREAKDSQFQQIVALVEDAAASRSPIVRLADRFAVPFALVAYAIAGVAWWSSGDPVRFAEVLVVATPCPLIIAAPAAFMAGMGRAAREGVIIRSSATLESLHRARTFAFDKTGTLTRGVPALVSVRPQPGTDGRDLLRCAAAVEADSAHALAAATVRGAVEQGMRVVPAEDAEESTAHGVVGSVGSRAVIVGKRRFVADRTGTEIARADIVGGEMAVYVALDGVFAGSLVFRDDVRPRSRATLDALRALGIRSLVMLTGDDEPTALHVAASLGITDVHANCLPGDKVAVVAAESHRPVAMVGDGVNDAPVLAAADIGIAMGARGATAASEAADIVILRDDIAAVADALAIGRRTVDIALQSIWIGMALSIGLMLCAAFGFVPALLGAWLQEAIDVIAILWALRATRAGSGLPSSSGIPRDLRP